MHVDGEQRAEAGPSDRQQDMSAMQASDLKVQQGVGRCYYTHLPRLVKVTLGARIIPCSSPCCDSSRMYRSTFLAQALLADCRNMLPQDSLSKGDT